MTHWRQLATFSIINSNTAEAKPVEAGFERTICGENLCGSKTLTVYRRTVLEGRRFTTHARDDYHLVYVMETSKKGLINFNNKTHPTEEGAGVLLAPGELARFEASGSNLELLHMVVPKPPAAVEDGLPGGPGYFFNRKTLRALSDASGGRVRRFCAESNVKLLDGSRAHADQCHSGGRDALSRGGLVPLSCARKHQRQPGRRRSLLHDIQRSWRGRSRGYFSGTRTRHACVFPSGRAASASRPWRFARLLRDPGLEKASKRTYSAKSRWDSSGSTNLIPRMPRRWEWNQS